MLMEELKPPRPDADEDADCDHVRQERSAAVAHERQRYPDNRHQAKGHAHIHKEIDEEHRGYPERKEPPEIVLGLSDRIESPHYENKIEDHEDQTPEKPPFLGKDGKDKVRMCFW